MKLHAEVDVPADGLADRGEARDEVVDAGRLAHQVVVVLEEQDFQRGVSVVVDARAEPPRRPPRCVPSLDARPHRANRAARAPAEQLPDRNLEVLALEIPQRLVERADRPVTAMPRKLRAPVEGEPVVLEVEGIPTTEVRSERA